MLICIALLCLFAYNVDGSHFRGSYITYVVNKTDPFYYPANSYSSYVKMHVKFGTSWRRSDGSSYCTNSSISTCQLFSHGSWSVYYGYSELSQPYYHSYITAAFYCERYSIPADFTVGYNSLTVYLRKSYVLKVSTSSCCWIYGLRYYSSSSWYVQLIMSLKQRPYPSYGINTPPQIERIPVIQHHAYQYSSYYAFMRNYSLPVSDPDNDLIECRWAANFTEGGGIWNSRVGILNKDCSLSLSTYAYKYSTGWYALAVMVEDFVYTYSGYVRMSSVPLQFTVYIYQYSSIPMIGNGTTACTNPIYLNLNPVQSSIAPFMASSPVSSSFTPMAMTSSVAPTMPPAVSASQASDGCKFYQVLSSNDRILGYNDWSSYRCDKELFGWYRFMGAAGNRMLDYCPNRNSPYNYDCGAYYQGWIMSGSLPSVYQGVVSRTVCFSSYYSCACSSIKQILIKNCGSFHVYWLDKPGICNSRYCGMKVNSSLVTCSQNYMRIDLDRRFYDSSIYSSITLKSPSCTASYSSSYITLGTIPAGCGGARKDTINHIVYENVVIMKAKSIAGVITRDMDQMVIFRCLYTRNGFVSSRGYTPISSVNVTEVNYGSFTFNFWMYKDRHYTTPHIVYPVSVQLRDQLYFEIQASVVDKDVIVLIDRCYSTPTMNRNHFTSYVFIQSGCAIDNTARFHTAVSYKQRFSLQAFKFLQNSTAVYFHCVVYLCHKSSSNSRCTSGCYGNNINRVKRSVDDGKNEPSKDYLLEIGVKLETLKKESTANKKTAEAQYKMAVGVAVGSMFIMAVVVAGLAMKMRQLKRQAKIGDCNQGNRYTTTVNGPPSKDESLPPAYDDPNMNEMKKIGILDESMQKDLFKDWNTKS